VRRSRAALLLAVVVGIAITAAVWVIVGRGSDVPPGPPAADVYSGVAAALTRPGMVAHVAFDAETSDVWISGQREAWLDVSNDAARDQTTTTYRSPSVSTTRQTGVIYRRGASYAVGEDRRPVKAPNEGCPGSAKRVLALFARCPVARDKVDTHTEAGRRFDGAEALALITTGKLSGVDSVVEVHNALFIDPFTYLPLAYESEGTDRYALGGYERKFHTTTRYRITFVSRDSLPPDFFDPASIGYTEADPEQALAAVQQKFPVFWLGLEYPGAGSLPALALSPVRTVEPSQTELGPTLQLMYSEVSDQFAELVSVSEVSAAYLRFDLATGGGGEPWRRDPCGSRTELAVPGVHATVYAWHIGEEWPCAASPPNGLALELDFGDTFVTVLPSVSRALNGQANPYASPDALGTLARAIRRRGKRWRS
jgi:hypothetical protein